MHRPSQVWNILQWHITIFKNNYRRIEKLLITFYNTLSHLCYQPELDISLKNTLEATGHYQSMIGILWLIKKG